MFSEVMVRFYLTLNEGCGVLHVIEYLRESEKVLDLPYELGI